MERPVPGVSRIVVAIRGDRALDASAVRLACTLASRGEAVLSLIYVVVVPRSLPLSAVIEAAQSLGEEALDLAEEVATEARIKVETQLLQAREVGPALVDEAKEWRADALVMGLPYRRRFGDFDFGNSAPYVIKNAHCHVILFREALAH